MHYIEIHREAEINVLVSVSLMCVIPCNMWLTHLLKAAAQGMRMQWCYWWNNGVNNQFMKWYKRTCNSILHMSNCKKKNLKKRFLTWDTIFKNGTNPVVQLCIRPVLVIVWTNAVGRVYGWKGCTTVGSVYTQVPANLGGSIGGQHRVWMEVSLCVRAQLQKSMYCHCS